MKLFTFFVALFLLSACSFFKEPVESPLPAENPTTSGASLSGSIPEIPLTPHDAEVTPSGSRRKMETEEVTVLTKEDDKEVEKVMKDIDSIFAEIESGKK